MRTRFMLAIALIAAAIAAQLVLADTKPADPAAAEKAVAKFRGAWTGKSICVGTNRPACKDETVVYRFVPFTGAPWQMRLLADKIIEGKRLPMGALMFQYDDQLRGLRCEFTKGNTHGVWSFVVDGDSLRGDLTVLPSQEKGRDVHAVRVEDESKLPAAPALKDYEE
ncbi:MAG TPA: hypothetical protein VJS69_10580 [Candidatus Krumholzibacteria bacterium]|nr:hypothetical protein [Candidatus Krumholzibacteria bacterium]